MAIKDRDARNAWQREYQAKRRAALREQKRCQSSGGHVPDDVAADLIARGYVIDERARFERLPAASETPTSTKAAKAPKRRRSPAKAGSPSIYDVVAAA